MIQTSPAFVVRNIPRLPRLSIPDTRIRPVLTTSPCSKVPIAQHVAHIGWRFAVTRNTASPFDGARAGVVSRNGKMYYSELVEHLPEISRRAKDICHWIEAVRDPKISRRSWHQLAQTSGASLADCQGIVARFCPHQRVEKTRRQCILRLCSIDMRQVTCPPKSRRASSFSPSITIGEVGSGRVGFRCARRRGCRRALPDSVFDQLETIRCFSHTEAVTLNARWRNRLSGGFLLCLSRDGDNQSRHYRCRFYPTQSHFSIPSMAESGGNI
jgi:hypothetical protein